MQDDNTTQVLADPLLSDEPAGVAAGVIDPKKVEDTSSISNIDFSKEAEEIRSKTKRTPQQEIEFNLRKLGERALEAGVDPLKVFGGQAPRETAESSEFVTKDDMARQKIRSLTKSESEFLVVLDRYQNGIKKTGDIDADVENAHFLAHKPRLKTVEAEIGRKVTPPEGAGDSSGQRQRHSSAPQQHPSHQALLRRGYKLVKPGLYQAKFNQERFDESSKVWVSEKIVQA